MIGNLFSTDKAEDLEKGSLESNLQNKSIFWSD